MSKSNWMLLSLVTMMAAPFAGAYDGVGPVDDAKPELPDAPSVLAPLGCSLGAAPVALSEGITVAGTLNSTTGANCEFNFNPDPNADVGRIFLNNICCDFDVYVKRGSPPTTSSYECRPFSGGTTDETCDLLVNGQTFYVMVRRFSSGGAFEVTASSVTYPTLQPGVPVTGNVGQSQMVMYKVLVPTGSSQVAVALAGPDPKSACTGSLGGPLCAAAGVSFKDADLYVRANNVPTTSLYTCRGFTVGSHELCVLSNEVDGAETAAGPLPPNPPGSPALPRPSIVPFAGPGKYLVGVRGFTGPADYAVVATVA